MAFPCRECKSYPGAHRRGLCRHCWERPEVRRKHPSAAPAPPPKHRGPPLWPTRALPGTPEQAEVIRRRLALGYSPFHDDDAHFDDDGRTVLPGVWPLGEGGQRLLFEWPPPREGDLPPRERARRRGFRGTTKTLDPGAAWGPGRKKVLWQRLLWPPRLAG